MVATGYAHLEIDERGMPRISGTRITVAQIAAAQQTHGYDAAGIQRQFPDLTLGEIYSALAYYHDHAVALDALADALDQAAHTAIEAAGWQEHLRARIHAAGDSA